MASMSMSMDMGTGTATATAAAATSSAAMDMSGMGGDACKISMLWNWYTIDACFLARSWRITSRGAFAGSCIGVILLVMVLEALRRGAREYDAYLVRLRRKRSAAVIVDDQDIGDSSSSSKQPDVRATAVVAPAGKISFRPTMLEQAVRALLHMLQFAVAYFIMLLAMYYNGYIIICIFIGAFLGAFAFSWTDLGQPQ